MLDVMTDAMTHRGPDDRGTFIGPGWRLGRGGCRSWMSRVAISRSAPRTGRICGDAERRAVQPRGAARRSCSATATGSRAAATPRSSRTSTSGAATASPSGCGACSGSRSGTARSAARCSHATGSGSSRSTGRSVDDLVVFASELKSVLASGLVPIELDYDAIDAYLTLGFVPAPTPRSPASASSSPATGSDRRTAPSTSSRYWRYPHPTPTSRRDHSTSTPKSCSTLLEESVRLRLMSDVPLGAMLSGGLDSSLIVALMAEQHRPSPSRPSASASAKTTQQRARRRPHASQTTSAPTTTSSSSPSSTTPSTSPTLVWHLDEPVADLSALGFLALSHLARQHVTVALSGQGADELFAGYRKHRMRGARGRRAGCPACCGAAPRSLGRRLGGTSRRIARGLRRGRRPTDALAMSGAARRRARRTREPRARCSTTSAAPRGRSTASRRRARRRPAARRRSTSTRSSRSPTTCSTTSTAPPWPTPSKSASPSSTTTSSNGQPPSPRTLKVRRDTTKYVLKEAARGLLPDCAIDKPKIGFFRQASTRLARRPAEHRYRRVPRRGRTGRSVPRPGRDPASGTRRRNAHAIRPRDLDPRGMAPRGRRRGEAGPRDGVTVGGMRYAIVSPVRNEERNLPRLAEQSPRRTFDPPSG